VKTLAHRLLMISAVFTPVYSFSNSCYFTLRSGGKTLITFLFDSCFCWAISVPAAFLLSRFTGLSTENMFFAVQTLELIKNVSGLVLVHRGRWINDITKYTEKG
ncbi:MAG: MATE family efflux transporter, partial [Clostridia bacterium]|nr:MATE family efflux transporter [Clostridia bacterium]